jgi:hypothetical protein
MTLTYEGENQAYTAHPFAPQAAYKDTAKVLSLATLKGYVDDYVGRVNAGGFGEYTSASAHTWLCTRIYGVSSDGGYSYETTFEFLKAPRKSETDSTRNTWRETGTYIKDDGHKVSAPTGDARKTFTIYEEADFSNLPI